VKTYRPRTESLNYDNSISFVNLLEALQGRYQHSIYLIQPYQLRLCWL